ncbi:MAG: YHS domain-containing protein [Deltaproteobacteria bacterium]|nr:YHS domain-containing protein [Deltaproteobacteria bacterium]
MAICPVCEMEVEEKKARGTSIYQEKPFYFCSKACKKKFDESPENYFKEEEKDA